MTKKIKRATRKSAPTTKQHVLVARKGAGILVKKGRKKSAVYYDTGVIWPDKTQRPDHRTSGAVGTSLTAVFSTSTMLDRALKRLADK